MEPLPVDILQLQRRDPVAWTAFLSRMPETSELIVTAVTAENLCGLSLIPPGRVSAGTAPRVRRYLLTIADHSDPVSFIVKQTNAAEAALYEQYGRPPATALPACHFVHHDGDESYVILDDVPDHYPPATWLPRQVDSVVATLARIHAAHWHRDGRRLEEWTGAIGHFLHRPEGPYSWRELREMPGANVATDRARPGYRPGGERAPGSRQALSSDDLSDHARRNTGRLAPLFLQAATGLSVMRSLNGWPGVLGQSQMAAAADLLDDPVPMLAPLLDLPVTLLHGSPHPAHWRLTLFDEYYLLDWSEVRQGPGVLDLVAFIEGYPLLPDRPAGGECLPGEPQLRLRPMTPLVEETAVDTYLLTLGHELGRGIDARAFRAALPAARCFRILLTWFPFFATWAGDMPDPYLWQRVNRLNDTEIGRYRDAPEAAMRYYLSGVFERFLQAYRSL